MLEELKQAQKVVGSKQARRALRDGRAKKIYIARDADPRILQPLAVSYTHLDVYKRQGLSPILSLVSIYVGMRLGGVLGMVLGPTVALIALNLVKLGLFEGLRLDLAAAAEDIMALLRERPEN